MPPSPITAATAARVTCLRRLGLGRLQGAAWTSSDSLAFGTSAGVFLMERGGAPRQVMERCVTHFVISPDRRRVAVALEAPREVVVLAAESGAVISRAAVGGGQMVTALGFSADGALVAVGTSDRELRLRRAEDGAEVASCTHPKRFTDTSASPVAVAWSPDGATIATANRDGEVLLWRPDGSHVHTWGAGRWVNAMAFTADGLLLTAAHPNVSVVSMADRHLQAWTRQGELARDAHVPSSSTLDMEVLSLAVSPDGRLLAAGMAGAVQILDLATWEPAARLDEAALSPESGAGPDGKLHVNALDFSPDGGRLAVVTTPHSNIGQGEDRITLQILEARGWTRERCIADFDATVNAISLARDGTLAIATDREVRLVGPDLAGARVAARLLAQAAAISPDGARLAVGSGSFRGEARVLDARRGDVLRELPVAKDRVDALSYSPDGSLLASACKQALVWRDGRKSPIRAKAGHGSDVKGVAFSPDGMTLATASWDGTVRLWAAYTMAPLRTLSSAARDRFNAAAFSPDGQLVAGVGYEGKVYLWRVADGAEVARLGEDKRCLWSVAFSPDGSVIADGSWREGEIRLWRVEDGALLATLRGHGDRITGLALRGDGSSLLSSSEDGTVREWGAP